MSSSEIGSFGRVTMAYGVIAGLLTIVMIIASIESESEFASTSMWFGYLIMLITLSLVFIGMKRYRDIEQGGVIGFWKAFALGTCIAAVAGVVYVLVWEAYLAATDYAFMEDYAASIVEDRKAAGLDAAELAAEVQRLEEFKAVYGNPFLRSLISFSEIFPVGFLVSLISALLLRKPSFLAARR